MLKGMTCMTLQLDKTQLSLSPVTTLRSEITNLLRELILNGDLHSGERLKEVEIANQLGVSRMPVREALCALESEGLVRQEPRKGLVVVEYTEADIKEYYTIREALEVCAIKIIIGKISEEELSELKSYCDKAWEAYEKNDIEEVCAWSAQFNEHIYDSCGMPRLQEQIKTTQKYLRTFRFTSFKEPARMEQAIREHKEILRCVEAKDYDGAAEMVEKHLRDATTAYIELWKKRSCKV